MSFPTRFSSWTKTPLPATQTAAFLLLLSAGATAAWMPPQTRARLTQPLVRATVHLAQSTGLHLPASINALANADASFTPPRVILASATTKGVKPRALPTLVVNSIDDNDDATPGDGICQASSNDAGVCTLRAAIEEANASGGGTINFNIPGAGVHTISPATQLPNIFKTVTINGYSQTGSTQNTLAAGDNAKILIELNGTGAGNAGAGLLFAPGSDGSALSGMAISGFGNGSAVILTGSGSNSVTGCFLGLRANGTTGAVNGFNGVAMQTTSNNAIGVLAGNSARNSTPSPATRNVISSNGNGTQGIRPGVLLINGGSGNTIRNNFIGTDATGKTALANGGGGVQIFSASTDTIATSDNEISNNLISGNSTIGVNIDGSKTTTTGVYGNTIGTDVTGLKALPNTGGGVQVTGATGNSIGADNITQNVNQPGNLISGNGNSGIALNGGANNNIVASNRIGINGSGTAALGNALNGIVVQESGGNKIGGAGFFTYNVVSGNGTSGTIPGILIEQTPTAAGANTISNNRVGTNFSGTVAIPNTGSGIQIFSASTDTLTTNGTIVKSNLLSGNKTYGIDIDGPKSTGTLVQGNKIGTDINGTKAIPNGLAGVQILGATGNSIGGGTAGTGNLISGNASAGIALSTGANSNSVQGNLIGTDVTGLKALSNGLLGVGVNNGSNNLILGNTITSATADGILIGGLQATGTVIQNNNIGVGSDGTTPLGNKNDGILFQGAAPGHIVGDALAGSQGARTKLIGAGNAGNIIANNGGAGVAIVLATAQACHRKSILGNSIYNNGGLGIDLNGDGVTANQPSSNQGDSTVGPNALQNYPILNANPTVSGGNITVSGSLTSAPNATFRIEFFASPTADPSGHGEGKTFLGFQNVTTNGSGTVSFSATLADSGSGSAISATATDAVGNTSEFSGNTTATTGPTPTPVPTATATPRPTATPGVTPTAAPTATPRPTSTPAPTATPTTIPTAGPTATPRPTATATPRPTATATPRPTSTPTPTPTPGPGLSINDVSITEGNSGTKNAVFTVTLTGNITSAVTVRYATANGTATAGSDYTAVSGILTFGGIVPTSVHTRALTQTISVPIIGDTVREADETFFVNLSAASGATISRSRGTGTILNDDLVADLAVTQTVSSPSVNTGGLATFTLTVKNNGPDTAQSVVVSDALPAGATFVSSSPNPTTQSGSTLTFALGTLASGSTRTITVQVRAPQSTGTLQNGATVAGSGATDPTAPNNGSTSSVVVTSGSPTYSFTLGKVINVGPYSPTLYHSGAHLIQDVTITNTGTASATGPLVLVLNGLPSTVTLVGNNGFINGSPTLTVLPTGSTLAVGQSTSVRLEFRLASNDKPTFSPTIIDGTQGF